MFFFLPFLPVFMVYKLKFLNTIRERSKVRFA